MATVPRPIAAKSCHYLHIGSSFPKLHQCTIASKDSEDYVGELIVNICESILTSRSSKQIQCNLKEYIYLYMWPLSGTYGKVLNRNRRWRKASFTDAHCAGGFPVSKRNIGSVRCDEIYIGLGVQKG